MSLFQWLTPEVSNAVAAHPERLSHVSNEIADVRIYLVRIADVLGIDPVQAALDKIQQNARRYPVEKSAGNARKWNEL
jgi:NTP pyrophosphatase (non-canonical NTP hydrolase)